MTTTPTPTPTPPTDRPAEQALTTTVLLDTLQRVASHMDDDALEDGGWRVKELETQIIAVAADRDALVARCAALYACVLDISDEAFLCGVSGDTSDRIREIEQRARAIMGDADRSEPDRDGAGEGTQP